MFVNIIINFVNGFQKKLVPFFRVLQGFFQKIVEK